MSIIRPKDFAIKGSQNREPDKVTFTSISKLEQTVEGEKSFICSCLLLQILYYKKQRLMTKLPYTVVRRNKTRSALLIELLR